MEIKFLIESIGTDVTYKVGDVADLGEARNKSAVERGRAEWVNEVKETKKSKK